MSSFAVFGGVAPSIRIGIWTEPSGRVFSLLLVVFVCGEIDWVVAALVERFVVEEAGVKLTGEEQGEST